MPSPSLQATRFDDATKSSYELAQSIMPSDTSSQNIKQFQSLDALVPILKELAPEVIYIEEGAVDSEGKVVEEILTSRMARSVVIVVGGGDDELAGLVSSDDESVQERRRGEGKWWGEAGDVRRRHGKMVEVVEKWALEDDWRRRVEEE